MVDNGEESSKNGSSSAKKTADVKIDEADVDFDSFMLKEALLKGLKRAKHFRPSPIQLKAIPIGRIGLDMVVQAKSGTGKTCVFTVLALENVELANPAPQVLIVTPTREIAVQIMDTVKSIGHYMVERKEKEFTGEKSQSGIKVECFIGGTTLQTDKDKSRLQKCQIIVGTPGRILQLINEGDLSLDAIRLFVLDEADKLMEESFIKDVNSIYAHLPSGKQLVVTSATYPRQLDEFLSRYMKTPTFVQLDSADVQLLGVKQYILTADIHYQDESEKGDFEVWLDKKIDYLNRLLNRVLFNQCMIFCNWQDKVETVAQKLTQFKWPAAFITANLSQLQRNNILSRLKEFKIRVLVSTDMMARGIDAENVDFVVHFDVPRDAETYFHRVGRAGRFGGYGASIAMILNRKEEMKFYALAAPNAFNVKKLSNVSSIPSDLVNNEKYFHDLAKLQFPSADALNKFFERCERDRPTQGPSQQRFVKKPTKSTPVDVDDYAKLMHLAGAMERWSPVDFVWEESGKESEKTVDEEITKKRQYSRSEMLGILKDNLSSLSSSRTSVATSRSGERNSPSASTEQPVKGQRLDVNTLLSYFQEQPTLKMYRYNHEELLAMRELGTRACAETAFDFRNLLNTFDQEKKKKKKRTEDGKVKEKPLVEEAELGSSAPIEPPPSLTQLPAQEMESQPKREPQATAAATEPKPKPIRFLEKKKPAKKGVDVRRDYDEAISTAVQSPFYRFFGDTTLRLQAAAVNARKSPPKADKEIQTDHVEIQAPSARPGWRAVAYNRDQMLAMWQTVATPDWSCKNRRYPWINVVQENGLLVDRGYGEGLVDDEGAFEEEMEEAQEDEPEESDDENEMRKAAMKEYRDAIREHIDLIKLYKKAFKKYHM